MVEPRSSPTYHLAPFVLNVITTSLPCIAVYFGKLVFEYDEQEFSLRGVKSIGKNISSHLRTDQLKSVLQVRYA